MKNAIRKLDGTELNGKKIRMVDVSTDITCCLGKTLSHVCFVFSTIVG